MTKCGNNNCSLGECEAPKSCAAYIPVRTNADRIRAMSDEELAEFLDKCENKGYEDSSVALDGCGHMMPMLDWLRQPAEEVRK